MFDIRSLTWDEWSYPEGVILPIVTLGTIRPEDSGAARNATSFIIKLYSETQVSGRLGMSGGISPRHAQNPLSGERRKTLSITHHALSPPPSHHYLYIIHLINWLQRFYRIIMSLKRPFVPKSDVKQRFTTTTTIIESSGCQLVVVLCLLGRFVARLCVQYTASTVLWGNNIMIPHINICFMTFSCSHN